eukprot:COSAG01_NODE_266_length_19876_cov_13.504525_6_plen_454_part_00
MSSPTPWWGRREAIERTLAPDSDAVESEVFSELRHIGRLLSRPAREVGGKRGPGALLRALQVLLAARAVLGFPGEVALRLDPTGLEEPTSLMYVSAALATLAYLALVPLWGSAHAALRPDDGALARLGAGRVKIGAAEARSLRRWRVGLAVLFGLAAVGFIPVGVGQMITAKGATGAISGVSALLLVPPLVASMYAWCLSSRVGSCLARDATLETMRRALHADPSDEPKWLGTVARPALALEGTYRELSAGWGAGFLALTLFFWLFALNAFAAALDPVWAAATDTNSGVDGLHRTVALIAAAFSAFLPLLLLSDIAATSSTCDALTTVLNRVRIERIEQPDAPLTRLEAALCKLNRGQGLGLGLGGVVVDRRTLGRLGVGLASTLTTVYSLLIGLGAGAHSSAGDDDQIVSNGLLSDPTCTLSQQQRMAAHAVFMGFNQSCTWNLTIGPQGII